MLLDYHQNVRLPLADGITRERVLLLTHDQALPFSKAAVPVQPAYEWLLAQQEEDR